MVDVDRMCLALAKPEMAAPYVKLWGILYLLWHELSSVATQSALMNYTLTHANLTNLIDDLLTRTDTRVRPDFYGPPTKVYCDFRINSFGSIDVKDMDFELDIYFRQRWVDAAMAYPEEATSGDSPIDIPSDLIKPENLWVPDLFFPNEKTASLHGITEPNRVYSIYHNGSIRYSQRLTLKLSCPMNLARFPMDSQKCYVQISTYSYDVRHLRLYWLGDNPVEVDRERLMLPQYEMYNITHGQCLERLKTGNFACLEAHFFLKRQLGYYMVQGYIPSLLIVSLSWVSFWIDKSAVPARITLTVTTMLTMTTMLTAGRSVSPSASYMKAIDLWYTFCMILVFLSLLEFVAVNAMCRSEDRLRRSTRHNNAGNDLELGHSVDNYSDQEQIPMRDVPFKGEYRFVPSLRIGREKFNSNKLDKFSRLFFPITFLLFNIIYWTYYLTEVDL